MPARKFSSSRLLLSVSASAFVKQPSPGYQVTGGKGRDRVSFPESRQHPSPYVSLDHRLLQGMLGQQPACRDWWSVEHTAALNKTGDLPASKALGSAVVPGNDHVSGIGLCVDSL